MGLNGSLTPYDSYSFNAGFASNSPNFAGVATAANNKALTGSAQGALFGPQGQEIGGTLSLQGGGTTVIGAFGGTATTPLPGALAGTLTGAADFGAHTSAGSVSSVTGGSGTLSAAGTLSSTPAFAPSTPAFTSVAAGTTTSASATSGAFFGANAAQIGGVLAPGATTAGVAAFGGAKH